MIVNDRRGLSLIELIVTVAILSILGMLVFPLTQMTAKRTKELQLRQNLREIRTAIDKYKEDYDYAVKQGKKTNAVVDASGYQKNLELLIEGEVDSSDPKGEKKKKYLRRIPPDPFNHAKKGTKESESKEWGLRSYKDKPDSTQWGGEDVFDVYSLSEETAIDGTKYKDW